MKKLIMNFIKYLYLPVIKILNINRKSKIYINKKCVYFKQNNLNQNSKLEAKKISKA